MAMFTIVFAGALALAPSAGVTAQPVATSFNLLPPNGRPLDRIDQNSVPPSDAPDSQQSSGHGSSGGGGNGGQTD